MSNRENDSRERRHNKHRRSKSHDSHSYSSETSEHRNRHSVRRASRSMEEKPNMQLLQIQQQLDLLQKQLSQQNVKNIEVKKEASSSKRSYSGNNHNHHGSSSGSSSRKNSSKKKSRADKATLDLYPKPKPIKMTEKQVIRDERGEIYNCDYNMLSPEACDITIKKFYDYRPQSTRQYFERPIFQTDEKEGIASIIPFFNEPSHELQQTLNSMYDSKMELEQLSDAWKNKPFYVCLIQDGWFKADASMREYLKDLFPGQINGVDWDKYFDDFDIKNEKVQTNAMFIIERKNYVPTAINTQKIFKPDEKKPMNLTLIIKINNRRKHNSHEWFLGKAGFAEAVNAKYLFLTDAFTLYSPTCLFYLVDELDNHKDLCATTGRQRLMTRDQQGSREPKYSFGYFLRKIQLFDFELANAVYNGAFDLGGLLPVIPGPCGMYRAEDLLTDKVRDAYFNLVNEEPSKTGIVLGNLRIAEDRVLSYYSVIKSGSKKKMSFNPLAVFYFEGETDLKTLMLQRRRWINGSIAGYIYLLFVKNKDFREWQAPFYRKAYCYFLLFCQFLIYCMVAISPGITIKMLYYGILYFLNIWNIGEDAKVIGILIFLGILYLLHIFIHNRKQFNYPIMIVLVILSFLTSVVSFSSVIHYTFTQGQDALYDIVPHGEVILYLGMATFFGPFLLAGMLSGRLHSVCYMIQSFIQYILFLPMMIAWFGSYSYSRTWDLSWGNRPANELNDISEDDRKLMQTKFKETSIKIILVTAALNIGIFFVPLEGQLIFMAAYFGIALIQMLFSFFYSLSKYSYKIKVTHLRRKIHKRDKVLHKENTV